MSNTLLTSTRITRKALQILHQKARFIGSINRQYDDQFGERGADVEGGKIGPSLQVRLPNQYTVREGWTASVQGASESSVTLTVGSVMGVDLSFSDAELSLEIDDFAERHLEPAMAVLTANLEAKALLMAKDIYNWAGTAGSLPTTLEPFFNARTELRRSLAPEGKLNCLVDSPTMAKLSASLGGQYNPAPEISKMYREGLVTEAAGFKWWESELAPGYTTGAQAGTPLVDLAGQSGATLNTKGWTNGTTIKAGSIFTIGKDTTPVNRVHPETKTSFGSLMPFVVTEDITVGADTLAAIKISPSIVTSGAAQNVTASPINEADIDFLTGAASTDFINNLVYHKNAFAFVTAGLALPKGMDMAAREVYDGISIRFLRGFDIVNSRYISRMDVFYGKATIRPQLACRVGR